MVVLRELDCTRNSDTTLNCLKRAVLVKKLHALAVKSGYEIIQTNGQRIYAPPACRRIEEPPRGCEVFIGKLHKNLFEDELIPVFESVGPLYKFRLMLDFQDQTRGYAFATYFSKGDADQAVRQLDGYEIRRGLFIGVFKSVDNRRLFLGNLPRHVTRFDVKELLKRYVDGVVDIIMYGDVERPHLNRGFVFVEFENHRLAAMARRQFAPENLQGWGQALYVDWADPLPDIHPKVMSKVSILYLKNLPLDYTSEEIYTIVCNIVGSQMVQKVHKMRNYAFAHFVNHQIAKIARKKLAGIVLTDQSERRYYIEAEWARPRRYSKKYRVLTPPDNFCTSVPPNIRKLIFQRSAENSVMSRNESLYTSFANAVRDTVSL